MTNERKRPTRYSYHIIGKSSIKYTAGVHDLIEQIQGTWLLDVVLLAQLRARIRLIQNQSWSIIPHKNHVRIEVTDQEGNKILIKEDIAGNIPKKTKLLFVEGVLMLAKEYKQQK